MGVFGKSGQDVDVVTYTSRWRDDLYIL